MKAEEVFRNPIQIGMVTDDLEKTLSDFQEILGIGPFTLGNRGSKEGPGVLGGVLSNLFPFEQTLKNDLGIVAGLHFVCIQGL